MPDGWDVAEVESRWETMVFIAERDGASVAS
jgi:hypothetical protein